MALGSGDLSDGWPDHPVVNWAEPYFKPYEDDSALAGDSVSNPSSASSAKPQSRCAAATAAVSSAQVGGAERSCRSDGDPLRMHGRRFGLEVTELLLLVVIGVGTLMGTTAPPML